MQLATKGQSIELKKKGEVTGPFHATLKWQTSVDLDLHCFYKLKSQGEEAAPTGFWGKVKKALTTPASEGQVYFGSKGNRNGAPWITLDQDSGVGDVGGDNEENMHFWDIDKIEHALIVANIFNKTTNFAQYNGRVIVEGGGKRFEVPLNETRTGSWCVVARIDNSSGNPQLHNVNATTSHQPQLSEYM